LGTGVARPAQHPSNLAHRSVAHYFTHSTGPRPSILRAVPDRRPRHRSRFEQERVRPNRSSLTIGTAWIAVFPILVAVVLRYRARSGYFWDDYAFLTRVQSNPVAALGSRARSLLPPARRPGSCTSGPSHPWVHRVLRSPHLFKPDLAPAAVYLLVSVTKDLAGPRAGSHAGLLFAALAPCPASWRGPADRRLLAIALSLAALHPAKLGEEPRGGNRGAAALLSKEGGRRHGAVLLLWDWITGKRPPRVWTGALRLGGLGPRLAAPPPRDPGAGFTWLRSEPRGYVGFANLAVSEFHARRYLLASSTCRTRPVPRPGRMTESFGGSSRSRLRSRAPGSPPAWVSEAHPSRLSIPRARRSRSSSRGPGSSPVAHDPSMAAYFVCLPAIGSSPSSACSCRASRLLWRPPRPRVHRSGSWCRRSRFRARTPYRATSSRRIGPFGGSRAVFGAPPDHSRAALRFWFRSASSGFAGHPRDDPRRQRSGSGIRDATLGTLRPERRGAHPGAEFLFRVTSALDVVEIDPEPWTFSLRRREPRLGGNPRDHPNLCARLAAPVNRTARYASSKGLSAH